MFLVMQCLMTSVLFIADTNKHVDHFRPTIHAIGRLLLQVVCTYISMFYHGGCGECSRQGPGAIGICSSYCSRCLLWVMICGIPAFQRYAVRGTAGVLSVSDLLLLLLLLLLFCRLPLPADLLN